MGQRRSTRWTVLAASAVMATALVVSTGGVAEAKRLINGSKDIATASITGKQIKDGSLTAADFSGPLPAGTPGAPGAPGQKGDTGAKGDQGIPGPGVPVTYYTWNASFTQDGNLGCGDTTTTDCSYPHPALVTSAQALPVNSYVTVVDFSITGMAGTCDSGDYSGLSLMSDDGGFMSYNSTPWTHPTNNGALLTGSTPTRLTISGSCGYWDNGTSTIVWKPIPSFTAKVTFAVVAAADTHPTTFN